jgi:hypothetical protein
MIKYYDYLKGGENVVWYFVIGLVIMIFAILRLVYSFVKHKSLWKKIQAGLLIHFSLVWVIVVWVMGTSYYLESKAAIEQGTVGEVKGIVENFIPMPDGYQTIAKESFDVKGVHFEYSDYERTHGFHQSKSLGGPIDEGKYVRIQYLDGRILRLWVKKK